MRAPFQSLISHLTAKLGQTEALAGRHRRLVPTRITAALHGKQWSSTWRSLLAQEPRAPPLAALLLAYDQAMLRGVTVREARLEDTDAIARVIAAVADEGLIATEPPVDLAARAQAFRRMIEAEGPEALWVLEEDGRVIGNAGVNETAAPGVLSLGMAILPEARGRGGGRALLEAIIQHACTSGAHKLELEVWPDNSPAIGLYTSAGFEEEGLRRDHYRRRDGSLRSALLMALPLKRSGG